MKHANASALLGILLLSACASPPAVRVSESHWQFRELSKQCEIQYTAQANPQIIWRAEAGYQGRLLARLLIQNASRFPEIKDGAIVKFVLNNVEFKIPLVKTNIANEVIIDYQSLAVLGNLFITLIPRSETMAVEINKKRYYYNNLELNNLLDLWTDCFIHHFR